MFFSGNSTKNRPMCVDVWDTRRDSCRILFASPMFTDVGLPEAPPIALSMTLLQPFLLRSYERMDGCEQESPS